MYRRRIVRCARDCYVRDGDCWCCRGKVLRIIGESQGRVWWVWWVCPVLLVRIPWAVVGGFVCSGCVEATATSVTGYRDLNARLQAQSGATAAGEQTGLPIGKQNTSADAASPPSEQPALLVREGPPSRHDMQQHNHTVSKLNDFG
jgi:hypothetical protein